MTRRAEPRIPPKRTEKVLPSERFVTFLIQGFMAMIPETRGVARLASSAAA